MIQRLFVTLSTLLLLASTAPIANPRTVSVTVSRTYAFPNAHVFLGIAVLGHHVGYIDGGYLIKKNTTGWLHIDWNRYGDWTNLRRTQQGPRDVSQEQLDAVLRTLVQMGFPASSMRSWRRAAPVGYDGFREGDSVLTIGQIMVDLGTVDDAEAKLEKLQNVAFGDHSPLDQIPNTNVDFYPMPFFGVDCADRDAYLQSEAISDARVVAATIAQRTHATLSAPSVTVPDGSAVLCPADHRPQFYRTGELPDRLHDQLSERTSVSAVLSIAGAHDEQPPAIATSDLPQNVKNASFNLKERFAGTLGKAQIDTQADAAVIHLHYDLGFAGKPIGQPEIVAEKIAEVRGVVAPADFVERDTKGDAVRELVDAYLLVRRKDAEKLGWIAQLWSRNGFYDLGTYMPFVADCNAAKGRAFAQALDVSKQKAEELASLLHTGIAALGAARGGSSAGDVMCGFNKNATLADRLAAMRNVDGPSLSTKDPFTITFEANVDAAWLLKGPPAAQILNPAAYSANVEGKVADDALMHRAFMQAAREAVVDNDNIVSLYEVYTDTWGGNHAGSQIVVLR